MKGIIISIGIVTVLIIGAIMLGGNKPISQGESTIIEGPMSVLSQVVEINAKGGYSPKLITAKANVPTTLKIETNGTFDCSAALTIPSIGYRTVLPSTGITEIEIPAQAPGTEMRGLCQMGMYDFLIRFN